MASTRSGHQISSVIPLLYDLVGSEVKLAIQLF